LGGVVGFVGLLDRWMK